MTFTLKTARAVRIASTITFLAMVTVMALCWVLFWRAWGTGASTVAFGSAALLGFTASSAHDMVVSFCRSFRSVPDDS